MIHWEILPFSELDTAQLYAIMRLRQQVFVVEQDCAFEDADGLDSSALHLCGWQRGQLCGYARLFAAGEARSEASIGRVVSCPSLRGQGIGVALMNRVVAYMQQWMPEQMVWIGAQERLCQFYARFGFAVIGARYLEDGIWHQGMQASVHALKSYSET